MGGDHAAEGFSIEFMYEHPQTAYEDFASDITNSKLKENSKRDNLPDPFAEEDITPSSSKWIPSSRSIGKRTAAPMPQTSNKKSSEVTMAGDEYVGVEEDPDSDETVDQHDDTIDEISKSRGAVDEGKTFGDDNDINNDPDDDQVDDQYEEDGEGEVTVEGLIQEIQALKEESESGFYPLIRALYHAARGEQFKKPQHKPQLSVCQSFLYDYVWNRLDTFLELSTVEQKDVLVAIIGIVDLDGHKDFPQHADLLSECRAAIELQYPKIRDHLQTYRRFVDDDDGLKEARLGELMKQLKEDMSRFEDGSDEMVVIEIL
ncbi:hypothetical protein BGZ80_007178 [Entomortierella chlamydospora]|uniref:Uncharacterized protein n=1 Tax=Entomortierella chlamydospora TaxID=101097 RepID=A0A9P6T259_9FUNG|nr:hypothetical protein BGZ80_007178 [Entomortierella chlamydospora]